MKCSEPANATISAAQLQATGARAAISGPPGWITFRRHGVAKNSFRKRKAGKTAKQSVPQVKALGQCAIPIGVMPVDIIQQATTTTYHHEEATSRCVILLVTLKVLGQMIDPLRQQRDLDISRSGVCLVKAISFDCAGLRFHSFCFYISLFLSKRRGKLPAKTAL